MAEYIKREAAIKAVEKADYTAISSDADDCKADYLREIIESVPAADVAPVVHGRWERRRNVWYCTNCGKGYKITYGAVAANMHNCCPHCGVVMDGGVDDG